MIYLERRECPTEILRYAQDDIGNGYGFDCYAAGADALWAGGKNGGY